MAFRDKILRRLHLVIGGVLAVPLILLGLTGSVLVFQPELQSLAPPDLGVAWVGTARSAGAILAAAKEAAPRGYAPSFFIAPDRPGALAQIRLTGAKRDPGPGGLQMFIDPVSLAVRAVYAPEDGLLRRIFMLHANLMMRDRSGRGVIGWLGVAMCGLGLSGIVLWWPRRRRFHAALTIRSGAGGYAMLRQLHGAVGIWSWVVFMAVSLTGVALAFPQTVSDVASSLFEARDLRFGAGPTHVEPLAGVQPLDVNGAVALAMDAVPDASLRTIAPPTRPDQPVRVGLALQGDRDGAPTVTVFVDPWARRIVELRDPREYSLSEWVIAWMHAVHSGHGTAGPWRLLVALAGLLPTLFAVSGIAMWLIKRRAADRARFRRALAAELGSGE